MTPGFDLPSDTWKTRNRIKTEYGNCASTIGGTKSPPQYDCGAANQTIRRIVAECRLSSNNEESKSFVPLKTYLGSNELESKQKEELL
ncbi:hypothetical protein J437_LFUL008239 [Ladona fulva]|uniref:Uncharacterized protein n=1 Tax=Ladona fulva TaxID=123851 RepID=A0A8K0K872_LADFU|nr:hypothetical protein J437_LFUL008239 [Ladona fulva]